MTYAIVVTGERDWRDRHTIFTVLDEELLEFLDPEHAGSRNIFDYTAEARAEFVLRHGVAEGADWIANDWGKDRGVAIERFRADWHPPSGYNPAAGPIRNREMAQKKPRAQKCVAFWGGRMRKTGSREFSGTLDMIKQALQHSIPVRIVPPTSGVDP